ncbi:MAG: AI-2E family transporter [Pseudomonadota bacterium]
MKDALLLNIVLSLLLVILIGWLLYVGRTILLPIFVAIISVYLMVSATEALRRLPFVGTLPSVFLQIVVLAGFTAVVFGIGVVFSATIREISVVSGNYEANLDRLIESLALRLDLDSYELWAEIEAATLGQIDLQRLVLAVLGGFTSFGATIFLVVVYAAFLLGEREMFVRKTAAAFPETGRAEAILEVVAHINEQVRSYITIKTLINIILGMMSFTVLWSLGADFALFWALLIALLNYIPYVGSYIAVAFPVLFSLAQFGDFAKTALLAALLICVQMFVGNYLEPRMIGRQLNLSPFVVLVSLSVWAALWGIPGAILAVPLTSILAIILSSFSATRPVALLLSERIAVPKQETVSTRV